MSLVCTETRKFIMYGSALFCAIPKDSEVIYALSQEAVDRIPISERQYEPCFTTTGGVYIHTASSDESPLTGAYEWSSMKHRVLLFSISAKTAQEYLPKLWAELQPGHPPTPPTLNITIDVIPTPSTKVH